VRRARILLRQAEGRQEPAACLGPIAAVVDTLMIEQTQRPVVLVSGFHSRPNAGSEARAFWHVASRALLGYETTFANKFRISI
jgi:hypothetical protein